MKNTLCLLLSASALAQAGGGQPAATSGLVEALGQTSVYSGCGCSFRRVDPQAELEGPIIFSSNYEGSARVATRSGAATLVATKPDTECRASAIGDRCVFKYRDEHVRVEIKAHATWVCPSSDTSESCEVTRLRGQMTTREGAEVEKLEIEGECGC